MIESSNCGSFLIRHPARDVVIEIKASGMCGSDLHVYRATFKPGDSQSGFKRGAEPVIAGHEPCGVVVAVGTGVAAREASIGQRVMDHHVLLPWLCSAQMTTMATTMAMAIGRVSPSASSCARSWVARCRT